MTSESRADLETAVAAAVAALIAERGPMDPAAAHAALWPYVRDAAAPYAPRSVPAERGGSRDRRTRPWQYVVRFWDAAEELTAETDPEVMEGTGNVPTILANLAHQLHGFVPDELSEEATRSRLPQLRNNLGRGSHATLRIPYMDEAGAACNCQMDVHRLET